MAAFVAYITLKNDVEKTVKCTNLYIIRNEFYIVVKIWWIYAFKSFPLGHH